MSLRWLGPDDFVVSLLEPDIVESWSLPALMRSFDLCLTSPHATTMHRFAIHPSLRLIATGPPSCRLLTTSTTSTTTHFIGRVTDLDDGSSSTIGQAGIYDGSWDPNNQQPEGKGDMSWENGVRYVGGWKGGKFHGEGAKSYSRGGGYIGSWSMGKREGMGRHVFAGKLGYEEWQGPFVGDLAEGKGTMVLVGGDVVEGFEMKKGKPADTSGGVMAKFEGEVEGLDDGSPSTMGVKGVYEGGWEEGQPSGFGVMRWENGIEYKGMWKAGEYHGHGRKLYSRGGGYEGPWIDGKRHGLGISFYGSESLGRHGILRWEGPFIDDLAHGTGQAYVRAEGLEADDERWEGDTAVKGPTIEFVEGRPVSLP